MDKIRPMPGFVVVVPEIPQCNFCGEPGRYDFATRMGPWAHGCEVHWRKHRANTTLGVGKGQMWITKDEAA